MRASIFRNHGFTLIELMIAMLVLSFISLGIYNATTETFKRRAETEEDGDFYNAIRLALDVIGRDVTSIYSPQAAALPYGVGDALGPSGASGASGQPPPQAAAQPQDFGPPLKFWGAPVNDKNVRPSRFQGEENKMTFVANTHARLYRDSRESELAKISYALEEQKNPEPGNPGKVLVKHEDPDVFNEDDARDSETDVRYALLDIVKNVTFEYLDGDKDVWNKKWDTESSDHKNKFPDIIKVTLEVYTPANTGNTFTVVQQYRPELQQP